MSIKCAQGVLQNTLPRGELANMGSQWVVFEATLRTDLNAMGVQRVYSKT